MLIMRALGQDTIDSLARLLIFSGLGTIISAAYVTDDRSSGLDHLGVTIHNFRETLGQANRGSNVGLSDSGKEVCSSGSDFYYASRYFRSSTGKVPWSSLASHSSLEMYLVLHTTKHFGLVYHKRERILKAEVIALITCILLKVKSKAFLE
ncbi:hypothetical protein CC79DRAFT_464617 [Sarocladium strictum]